MHNKWHDLYLELQDYQKKNGYFVVLKGDIENKELRLWIREQIKLYKNNSLSSERFNLLSNIGFDFSIFGKQWDNWEKNFKALKLIYESTGNSNVSQLTKGIGPWLSAQRVKYRHGELSESRVLLLESIDINWNPSNCLSEQWYKQFNKLKNYYLKHGNSDVGRDCEGNLGTWVSAQRTSYRKKIMSNERISALESIDFKWELKGS